MFEVYDVLGNTKYQGSIKIVSEIYINLKQQRIFEDKEKMGIKYGLQNIVEVTYSILLSLV